MKTSSHLIKKTIKGISNHLILQNLINERSPPDKIFFARKSFFLKAILNHQKLISFSNNQIFVSETDSIKFPRDILSIEQNSFFLYITKSQNEINK